MTMSAVWFGCTRDDEEGATLDSDNTSSISGVVGDADDQMPISDVIVTFSPTGKNTITDSVGGFRFVEQEEMRYLLTVSKSDYVINRMVVTAVADETVELVVAMNKK